MTAPAPIGCRDIVVNEGPVSETGGSRRMDWLLYVGLAVVIVAVAAYMARARRKKQQQPDDIYPMW